MAIPIPNLPSNVRVPLFYASVDPSRANTLQQNDVALLVGQITSAGSLTPPAPISGSTNATTASGNATLHFAATPAGVAPGMVVTDTTPSVIPSGTTVVATTATTVTISANATGAGVGSGDSITFTTPFAPAAQLGASQNAVVGLAGAGSQLARLYGYFCKQNPQTTVYVLGLQDDGAAVKASGFIDLSGTATAAGVLSYYIAGSLVPVSVTTAMTAAQIATAIAAAINAATDPVTGDLLPVTAAASQARVTLTAVNGGAVGNAIDIRQNYYGARAGEATPLGLSSIITAMSGGATNPSAGLAAALALLPAQAYDFVVHPYSDSSCLNAVQNYFSDVSGQWSPTVQLYGGAFTAALGSFATLQTLGLARNDQHHSIAGIYDCPTDPIALAGAVGGFAALSLSADPSVPARDVPLVGILPPPLKSRFQFSGNNTLLWSGISTLKVEGEQLLVQRLITTYQTNTFGAPDNSMLSPEKMYTLAGGLRLLRGHVESVYGRAKLADDGTRLPPEANVATPNVVRADLIGFYDSVLVKQKAWFQDTAAFSAGLVVERNATDPDRLDVLWDGIVMDQLNVFAVLAQFRQVAAPA